MRIGIFETEHYEGIYPIIRLFDNGKNEITIFTYPESWLQLQHLLGERVNHYQWTVKEEHESRARFIRRMYRTIRRERLELIYLNTISDNFIFYAGMVRMLGNRKCILTLHEINDMLRAKLNRGFRGIVRYIGKKQLTGAVREFNVVAETMLPYLHSLLPAGKKTHCLPGSIFEESQYQSPPPVSDGKINIVVPGSVDENRRDYGLVFGLLESCRQTGIQVKVTLLGGYNGLYGQKTFQQCKDNASAFDNLVLYEKGVVDQPEFDRVMYESHLVFTPSVIRTLTADGNTETYGISKSSGNIPDIVRFARPCILPRALAIPDAIGSSTFQYETVGEIVTWLHSIAGDPSNYASLLEKARNNSRYYTIESIRERDPALFGQ